MTSADQSIDVLVKAGLLDVVSPGIYQVHDYLDYQQSAKDAEKQKEQARIRKARSRERHASVTSESRDGHTVTSPSPSGIGVVVVPPVVNGSTTRLGKTTPGGEVRRGGPKPPAVVDMGFDQFWEAYPKKRAKDDAVKAWTKLDPNATTVALILQAVSDHKKSLDWLKEGGKFIPYPATWLNGKRWNDVLETGVPIRSEKMLGNIRKAQNILDRDRGDQRALTE